MTQVACGWHHTILVSDSNKLFTFGWSKYIQLGHGDFQDHLIPHQVKALQKTEVQSVSTFRDVLLYLSPESQNVQGFFCAKKFLIVGWSSALITSFCCIILGVCTVGKEIYVLTLKAYVLSDLDHICTDIQGLVPYYGIGQWGLNCFAICYAGTILDILIPKSKFQILQFQNQNSQISFSCRWF